MGGAHLSLFIQVRNALPTQSPCWSYPPKSYEMATQHSALELRCEGRPICARATGQASAAVRADHEARTCRLSPWVLEGQPRWQALLEQEGAPFQNKRYCQRNKGPINLPGMSIRGSSFSSEMSQSKLGSLRMMSRFPSKIVPIQKDGSILTSSNVSFRTFGTSLVGCESENMAKEKHGKPAIQGVFLWKRLKWRSKQAISIVPAGGRRRSARES